VVAEDVRELRGDDGVEAVVLQCPDRVLTTRPNTEVLAGHEDGGTGEALVVQHEATVVAPRREQAGPEAGPLDLLQPLGGDDLVGVDVRPPERDGRAGDDPDRLHRRSSGVAKWPATAVAAATAGDTRCVRPPLPWRPSKLRFDVLADRSPGVSLS